MWEPHLISFFFIATYYDGHIFIFHTHIYNMVYLLALNLSLCLACIRSSAAFLCDKHRIYKRGKVFIVLAIRNVWCFWKHRNSESNHIDHEEKHAKKLTWTPKKLNFFVAFNFRPESKCPMKTASKQIKKWLLQWFE